MIQNPIRRMRQQHGKKLIEFAEECNVHYQGLYLNERGVYPRILPRIRDYLIGLGGNGTDLDIEYKDYQTVQRETNGVRFCVGAVQLLAPSPSHPVVAFRGQLFLSKLAFCKVFCIHPAEMNELESGAKHTFSEQFKLAMTEAGLPATVLDELEFRCGEYARGEWVSREAGVN